MYPDLYPEHYWLTPEQLYRQIEKEREYPIFVSIVYLITRPSNLDALDLDDK